MRAWPTLGIDGEGELLTTNVKGLLRGSDYESAITMGVFVRYTLAQDLERT